MKRTKYFADTAPGEDQLNYHVDSAVESIEERFLGTALPGVEIGLTVIPGSDPNSKINIGPGTGFVPNGDRIYVGSVITNRAFANTVGVKYYVAFLYVEVEDSPLPERFNPVQHNTLVHDSYSLEVLTATQWAALTTSQRAERLLVAIVTGTGGVITTANIQNAVLPGKGVYSSQPVYITGVFITRIDQNTASGTGSLSFALGSPPTLTWTAPGDSAGAPVLITGTGDFTIYSAGGNWIIVSVTATQLPLTPATDGITVGRIYNPDIPALTARDELHRSLVGTGYPSVINPHGLSLEDLGVSEVGLTKEHQNIMHSNGIAKISDPGALVATPNVGGSGGFVNDYLAVAFPVGSDDTYYVRGRKLTSIAPSTVSFDAVSAQLHLYEIYLDELGVLTRSERAVSTARQTDGIWIIAMDEEVDPNPGYILWYSRDAGANCQIRWNGGPIRSFVSGEHVSNTHWLVLEGIDGRRVTVFIDDAQLPAGPITRQDTYTVNDPLDRLSYLILQQVAFDGNKGVGLQLFYSITGTTEFITDQRVFGTLGPNAEADTLDRLYEEEGWAQRLYTSGVLWGLDITSASPTATSVNWAFGKAYVGGKKFDVPAGTIDLTVAATYYIYVDEYGDVQASTINPSILVSERYPLRNLPYALLATAISNGAAVAVTISRKAPDFVAGNIYQQGTARYMINTNSYPHTCGCGLWRDEVDGLNYVMRQFRCPDWSSYYDKFGSIRDGGFWGCHPGAGYGVTGYGTATGGGGVQGIGQCMGTYGCQCGANAGVGVYGYARNTAGNCSGYGVIGYAPFAGGYGVFGCGYSVGGYFTACDTTLLHYGLYGCAMSSIAGSFGVYGQSGYGGVYGYATTLGVQGWATGAGGNAVLGCAPGTGGIGGWFSGDILGVCGRGAGTGSVGVFGCGPSVGVCGCGTAGSGSVYGVYGYARGGVNSTGGIFYGYQNAIRGYGDVCGLDVYGGTYGGVFCLCCQCNTGAAILADARQCGKGVCAFAYSCGGDFAAYGGICVGGPDTAIGAVGYSYGTGLAAIGFYGNASYSASGVGVCGVGLWMGVRGTAVCSSGTALVTGVYGWACESVVTSRGVYGFGYCGGVFYGNLVGVMGCAPGSSAVGVLGCAEGTGGIGGWFGVNSATGYAIRALNPSGMGGYICSTNYYGLCVDSYNCHAIIGRTSANCWGVYGDSAGNGGAGVYGNGYAAGNGCPAYGVYGRSENCGTGAGPTCSNCAGLFVAAYTGGIGVYALGYNVAVAGYSTGEVAGIGVYGEAVTSGKTGAEGVHGVGNCRGVYGRAWCNNGIGVYGTAPIAGGIGVCGDGCLVGVQGITSCNGAWVCGVGGCAGGTFGIGVWGCGTCCGVYGTSPATAIYGSGGTIGVYGYGSTYGVRGSGSGSGDGISGTAGTGYGAYGFSNTGHGVSGCSNYCYGVYGCSAYCLAGFFCGNVCITGCVDGATASAGVKGFKIDHPLDPYRMTLWHVAVESPLPTLVYKGRACLCCGVAKINLPSYFANLTLPDTRELSLTPINGWAPLYLAGKVGSEMTICSGLPEGNLDQEFSWVVYADRCDRFILKNMPAIEQAKEVAGKMHYCGIWSDDEIEQMKRGEWRP